MIRKAEESDIESILNVLSYYNFKIINPIDGKPLDDDYSDIITLYNQVSEINLQNSFVALHNRKIVGFSNYKHLDDTTAKTTLIAVLPEYRGLGIGKDLQLARMKETHQKGYKKLLTFCESPKTVDWYIKHFNYKIIGAEPVYHRLHFLNLKDHTIWAVHYGYKNQKSLQVIVCDLDAFFNQTREKNGKTT